MRLLRGTSSRCLIAVCVIAIAGCAGSGSAKPSAAVSPTGASTSTVPSVTPATQIISDSVPQGAKRLHFETGPFPITPGQNNIGFTRSIPQPAEDGYIVGISTNLRLADGSIPPVDVIHLHHGVWLNVAAKDET